MLETIAGVEENENHNMPVKVEPLDFDEIRTIQKNSAAKKQKAEVTLTEQDLDNIEYYVNDMANYIRKYAAKGETRFQYDCSPLSEVCFLALAERFKKLNPRFFVMTQLGQQVLTVDWSNKSEV